MLSLIFTILSLAVCESDNLVLSLIFGTADGKHYCDCDFIPHRELVSATIFKVIDQDVAWQKISAKASPSSAGYSRIEIPESLAIEGISYSFQFEFSDGSNAFSESFEFDPSKGKFNLFSALQLQRRDGTTKKFKWIRI